MSARAESEGGYLLLILSQCDRLSDLVKIDIEGLGGIADIPIDTLPPVRWPTLFWFHAVVELDEDALAASLSWCAALVFPPVRHAQKASQ